MGVLERGRAAIERRMADACVIRRRTDDNGADVTDDFSGTITPTYATLYTGKCRVQQITGTSRPHDAGEDFVLVQRIDIQLPVAGTEGLRGGDEVRITSSVNDQDLVNRTFLVHDLAHKSEATARRVGCTERTDS